MTTTTDPRAPMAAAPIKYAADGTVDWGNMWDSFCVLAREGGPPHRATLLPPDEHADPADPTYLAVVAELVRGIEAVSGLPASAAAPGWVAVRCTSAGMAAWLAESIEQEHVAARSDGLLLLVPAGASFTLKSEIKNVITAVAKTTHYWGEHLAPDVKRALALHDQLGQLKRRVLGWLRPAV